MNKRDLKADLEAIRDGRVLFKDLDPNSGIQYELYEVTEHAIERALKAEAFVMELVSSLKESIEYCEVCRDEYAYSNNPPKSRLCARCQTFYLHVERVKEVLGDG